MTNKRTELKFNIAPYYELVINKEGIKVYSYSNYRGGIKKELSQYFNKAGYLRIKMNNKNQNLHQLVAEYCIGPKPNNKCVNHIDGNKLNNYPENLEYITLAENTKHSYNMGLHVAHHPENNGRYKHGRAVKANKKQYKKEWYYMNKERISQNFNNVSE